MSKLKKRNLERKGDKKKQLLENKLIEDNLEGLTETDVELEEIGEEDF